MDLKEEEKEQAWCFLIDQKKTSDFFMVCCSNYTNLLEDLLKFR
jgi:hypothetical protein